MPVRVQLEIVFYPNKCPNLDEKRSNHLTYLKHFSHSNARNIDWTSSPRGIEYLNIHESKCDISRCPFAKTIKYFVTDKLRGDIDLRECVNLRVFKCYGNSKHIIEINGMHNLVYLQLDNYSGMCDLPNLKYARVRNSYQMYFNNVSNLTNLDILFCHHVIDVSALRNLRKLRCVLQNINGIASAKYLEELNVIDYLSRLNLHELPRLRKLTYSGPHVILDGSTQLNSLRCSETNAILTNLPNLTNLSMIYCKSIIIDDLPNVEKLYVRGANDVDISKIKNVIRCDVVSCQNVSNLHNLNKLEYLMCSNCGNISNITCCKNLKIISMGNCHVSSYIDDLSMKCIYGILCYDSTIHMNISESSDLQILAISQEHNIAGIDSAIAKYPKIKYSINEQISNRTYYALEEYIDKHINKRYIDRLDFINYL